LARLLVQKRGICRLADYGYFPTRELVGGWFLFQINDEDFLQQVKNRLDAQAIPWRDDAD